MVAPAVEVVLEALEVRAAPAVRAERPGNQGSPDSLASPVCRVSQVSPADPVFAATAFCCTD